MGCLCCVLCYAMLCWVLCCGLCCAVCFLVCIVHWVVVCCGVTFQEKNTRVVRHLHLKSLMMATMTTGCREGDLVVLGYGVVLVGACSALLLLRKLPPFE